MNGDTIFVIGHSQFPFAYGRFSAASSFGRAKSSFNPY
jgi:hypothetical protein